MLRLAALLTLLFFNLHACKGNFSSCKQKVIDSKTIQACTLSIPVEKHKRILFAPVNLKEKILKHDPFLDLYLVEDKKGFAFPFYTNTQAQLDIASISTKAPIIGKINKKQIGLNTLAGFSKPIFYPSIITSSCCFLEAIVTPDGIIEKEYIKHFLKTKETLYSDVGIRIKEEKNKVIVRAVDPFMSKNPFEKEDEILSMDGKKIKSASTLMQQILFSKLGSSHKFEVKRKGTTQTLSAISYKRYGGGKISDTFLEQKGIYFDEKLTIIDLQKNFASYGLLKGDTLIGVNGTSVKTQEELRDYMSEKKNISSLLIARNGFEFFVELE